jgi:hypothetical protein
VWATPVDVTLNDANRIKIQITAERNAVQEGSRMAISIPHEIDKDVHGLLGNINKQEKEPDHKVGSEHYFFPVSFTKLFSFYYFSERAVVTIKNFQSHKNFMKQLFAHALLGCLNCVTNSN